MSGERPIPELYKALQGSEEETNALLEKAVKEGHEERLADDIAELILAFNDGELETEEGVLKRLMEMAQAIRSERLRTVAIGTLWREDLDWLSLRIGAEETVRERLLRVVAEDRPQALAPMFWRAVSEQGPRYAAIAFRAAGKTHPHEAAKLLVSLCRAALAGQIELDIRSAVDNFLENQDSSVRTTFLGALKRMPETERRKLMNHLDMSLMAELDRSAIEHRAKGFFYDEEAEQRKRDSKSKDIFGEVRRRLEKGEKPQL